MSMTYLGETFDIHGGGIDLIFPHHENEIAQSETATGQPFARYWLHNGLTRMRTKAASGDWKNEKMSKSLGNIRTIEDLLKQWPGAVLRYFLLSTQYRSPIDFSDEAIAAAKKGLESLYRLLERVERLSGQGVYDVVCQLNDEGGKESDGSEAGQLRALLLDAPQRYEQALDDDFNTAGAISILFELCNALNRFIELEKLEAQGGAETVRLVVEGARQLTGLGQILGLLGGPLQQIDGSGDNELTEQLMQVLIELRAQARKDKNFALADAVRDKLAAINVVLEDRADGTVWSRQ